MPFFTPSKNHRVVRDLLKDLYPSHEWKGSFKARDGTTWEIIYLVTDDKLRNTVNPSPPQLHATICHQQLPSDMSMRSEVIHKSNGSSMLHCYTSLFGNQLISGWHTALGKWEYNSRTHMFDKISDLTSNSQTKRNWDCIVS